MGRARIAVSGQLQQPGWASLDTRGPARELRRRLDRRTSSFPRTRESMLSISGYDDSRKLIGNRWIPAFAGMTTVYERRSPFTIRVS
jgi:hypothetical protein